MDVQTQTQRSETGLPGLGLIEWSPASSVVAKLLTQDWPLWVLGIFCQAVEGNAQGQRLLVTSLFA